MQAAAHPRLKLKTAGYALLIAFLYFLTARFGLFFVAETERIAVIWPPSGFVLGVLLLSRRGLWAPTMTAIFIANCLANLHGGNTLPVSLGFALANTIEPLVCVLVITRLHQGPFRLESVREVLSLIVVAAGICAAFTALVGAAVPALGMGAPYWPTWRLWWIADGVGMIIITPFIMTVPGLIGRIRNLTPRERVEKAAIFVLVCLVTWHVFRQHPGASFITHDQYMIFPLLIWMALRFGPGGVALAVLGTAGIGVPALLMTTHPHLHPGESLPLAIQRLQLFLAMSAFTSLILAAMVYERRKTEQALRSSEQKFRSIIEQGGDGFELLDENGRYNDVNEATCRMLGYTREELLSMALDQVETRIDLKQYRKIFFSLHNNPPITFESEHRRKDGSVVPVEVTASVIRLDDRLFALALVRDITDRKQQEADKTRVQNEAQNVQRLESLGLLAGGIAHDFNNLLTGVFGYIELARHRISEQPAAGHLDKSLGVIDRARSLTKQLLTFARGGAPERKTGDLAQVLRQTVPFGLSGSTISLSLTPDQELWPCSYDEGQLSQVVNNIIVNAREAMPGGGAISVTARNEHLAQGSVPELAAGPYVHITLTDTGIGMDEKTLQSLFDPFFTTKHQGSGLGLATSFSIIRRHEGMIRAESVPGSGSTFHLYLPALPDGAPNVSPAPETGASAVRARRVLVMDDEPFIHDIITMMLEEHSCRTVCVLNGEEALETYTRETEAGRPFDAIILDLTVPGGMGGVETARRIRERDPDMPLFVSSGYAEDPVLADPGAYGFTGSLRKPFKQAQLLELLCSDDAEDG